MHVGYTKGLFIQESCLLRVVYYRTAEMWDVDALLKGQ
jgi:hypothetical protein